MEIYVSALASRMRSHGCNWPRTLIIPAKSRMSDCPATPQIESRGIKEEIDSRWNPPCSSRSSLWEFLPHIASHKNRSGASSCVPHSTTINFQLLLLQHNSKLWAALKLLTLVPVGWRRSYGDEWAVLAMLHAIRLERLKCKWRKNSRKNHQVDDDSALIKLVWRAERLGMSCGTKFRKKTNTRESHGGCSQDTQRPSRAN